MKQLRARCCLLWVRKRLAESIFIFISAKFGYKVLQWQLSVGWVEHMADTGEEWKIFIAATYTSEPLAEAIQAFLTPFSPTVKFAPYNQLFAQLLDPLSEMRGSQAYRKVILLRPEDWLRYSTEKKELRQISDEFLTALQAYTAGNSEKIVVGLCPRAAVDGVENFVKEDEYLQQNLAAIANVSLLDLRQIHQKYSIAEPFDFEGDALGHIPYRNQLFVLIAYELARRLFVLNFPPRKVVALDCDNTIWCGVVGEDGAAGVKERIEVTRFAVEQMKLGKLICLASKNEPQDVWDVFDLQQEMALTRDMIVHAEINWESKSGNLLRVAEALNVGVDSFIFVDDNPIECAEVAMALPQLITLNIPKEDEHIDAILRHHWAFDQLKVTEEDRKRTEMMRQNMERKALSQNVDYETFLASIQLQIDCAAVADEEIERAAQLTQRTNQFNSTTIRRTESDVRQLLAEGACVTRTLVSDRFGSYGFVGLTISYIKDEILLCDSFLLSCRVLGKRVENQMVRAVLQNARRLGIDQVAFLYQKSERNTPLVKFFQSLNQGHPLEQKGQLVYRLEELEKIIDALSVDYGDVEEGEKKGRAGNTTDISSMSTHLQELAFCRGEPDLLTGWVTQKRTKTRSLQRAFTAPETETQMRLAVLWCQALFLESVGIDDPFFELGGDSLAAARILAEVNRHSSVPYPMSTFYERQTIRAFADLLDGNVDEGEKYTYLVKMTSAGNTALSPFFIFPGMFGQIFNLRHLVAHFNGERHCYGLQARGVDDGLSPFESIEEMVAAYYQEICQVQAEGPYYLLGYCSGGMIALDIAKRLLMDGKSVAMVAMIDTRLPDQCYPAFGKAESAEMHRQRFKSQGLSYFFKWLFTRTDWEFRKLKARLTGKDMRVAKNDLRAWHVADAYMAAVKNYVVTPVDFPVLLYKVSDVPLVTLADGRVYNQAKELISSDNDWGRFIKRLTVIEVPGDHDSMLAEPNISVLAKHLQGELPGVTH